MASLSFGDVEEIAQIIGLLLDNFIGFYDWRSRLFDFWVVFGKTDCRPRHFVRILVAKLKLHEHVVEHSLCASETVIDHVLGGVNEPVGLIFGDGRDVMPSRNAIFNDFIAILGNDSIFFYFLLRLLDFQ